MAAPKKAPFEYSALDKEMQKQILTERLRQVEAEHFNHSTNLGVILGQPFANEAERDTLVATTQQAISDLENAHSTLIAQMADL